MKTRKLKLIKKNDWIRDKVKGSDVLHIGCTDWPLTAERLNKGELLHAMLCEVSKKCVGVDLDDEGIGVLKGLMPSEEFHVLNAEQLTVSIELTDTCWDYIVAGDVVEHMDNPGLFFQQAHTLLKDSGTLIVTVPSAYSAKRFFWLLFTGVEQVHPDHTAYFSEATLSRIGERNGFNLEVVHGFQWINATLKNRLAYFFSLPIILLSGGRMADELAVEFKKCARDSTTS